MSRPSLFKPEYIEQAKKLALLGATDKDLANFFDVTEQTINNWKRDFPEFFESLKEGKEILDSKVVEPMVVETTKHYPPDTTACIFWLKNRQKEDWRDTQAHEHSGKNGGPIEMNDVTDLEAARAIAYMFDMGMREVDKCH